MGLFLVDGMAVLYEYQGEYGKALEFHEKGLEIKLKTLGLEHFKGTILKVKYKTIIEK